MEIAYDHTEMLLLTLHANNAKLISHLAGMGSSQKIPNATFTGQPDSTLTADLVPGQAGINFHEPNGTITFPFGPGVTPIVTSVSVPKGNTNVDKITVTIKAADGTTLFEGTSTPGTNNVTGFPVTPLPEGSTVTVTLYTPDNKAAVYVTLSVIACYSPSTTTTVVTTGTPTATPTATTVSTSSGSTLTVSSVTSVTTQTQGK